eukprot:TRINITY_DN1310_c1_g1_i1.p1 TRINITY_DN1310_c1_g1~~TRINITY_DN1310_c1_g1_i1.p1  ORF type:complete len:141 (-),score=37.95 TRINITY_DN1310_c1_g1_i1:189-611(-)
MEIIQRSREQQHCWNCPYQLTRIPPLLRNRYKSVKLDSAKDCELYDIAVKEGDLVILYSDGFSDNLFEAEIVKLIDQATAADGISTPPEEIAEVLAVAAQERSNDPKAVTPFMKEAQKQGKSFVGGKVDDVTVVAGWVIA